MKKTRILIADDHEVVRRGIRFLLGTEEGWEICGEASTGREAVELAEKLRPDVVIIDLSMPELGGIEATRQIKHSLPDTQVLVFTGTESESLVNQLFAAGARGCVLKTEATERLIPAVKALSENKPYLGSKISEMVFNSYLKGGVQPADNAPDGLSPREREIVTLLADGKSNKEVATTLGISVKTVETHRAAIMKKLGFSAFSELVRYAVRNHLVQA